MDNLFDKYQHKSQFTFQLFLHFVNFVSLIILKFTNWDSAAVLHIRFEK